MDLNLTVLIGRVAAEPELREFESGSRLLRLLVTVKTGEPRRRVDVIPVTLWEADDNRNSFDDLADLRVGQRVSIAGSTQRRFWSEPEGRRSRIEVVAEQIATLDDKADAA